MHRGPCMCMIEGIAGLSTVTVVATLRDVTAHTTSCAIFLQEQCHSGSRPQSHKAPPCLPFCQSEPCPPLLFVTLVGTVRHW